MYKESVKHRLQTFKSRFYPEDIKTKDTSRCAFTLVNQERDTSLKVQWTFASDDRSETLNQQVSPRSPQNVVDFTDFAKEKSLTNRKFARLS